MIRWIAVCCLGMFVLLSCGRNDGGKKHYYFDIQKLIDEQIASMSKRLDTIVKAARINDAIDTVRIASDSSFWAKELLAFRCLDAINRPIYTNMYEIVDEQHDPNSNLMLKTFRSKELVPVSLFSIYYLDNPKQLKRISAVFEKEDLLYATRQQFIMNFVNREESPYLSSYTFSGWQKMIFADTVSFSVMGWVE